MKERPILVAGIGYIIGILWGLYFTFSIVLCYILFLSSYFLIRKFLKKEKNKTFKLLSWTRYRRYLKILFDRKSILILIVVSILSNAYILNLNQEYEKAYQEEENMEITAVVTSDKIEKTYYDLYQIKLLNSKNFNLYIQISKNSGTLEYGDKIKVQGEYKKPAKQRNYGGYDDEQYLKTLKIIGRIQVKKVEILEKNQINPILQRAHQIRKMMIEKIEKNFDKENSAMIKGLLLGEIKDIQEDVKTNFQISNISHILAISGMHIAYLMMGMNLLLKKILGKRKTKIVTILSLIFYAFITGFSPSIVRAVLMGVIVLVGELIHRKSDIINSISISLFLTLMYNPFLIFNVGLQLSYLGTLGIVLLQSTISQILKKIRLEKIRNTIAISLSAQIAILPILLYHFNTFGIYFLITNLLVSFVIGPIIICSFASLFISFFSLPVKWGVAILNFISEFSQLPFSKIYVPTLSIFGIAFYFICVILMHQIYQIYHLDYLTTTQKRMRNLIALFRYQFFQKKKVYLAYLISFLIILGSLNWIPKDLKIHFVDVGQGDCTFIVTPKNQTILIDGGGSLTEEFNVGKKTLLPYLLDRGYTCIDYIMISHADLDHIRTGF